MVRVKTNDQYRKRDKSPTSSLLAKPLIAVILFPLLAVSCAEPKKARISEIEHIYVRSAQAQQQFIFFTEQLGLPIVWNYENWGNFTSGGVSLGNLVLEIIDANHSEKQLPYGIALKPEPNLKSVIRHLDKVEIQHGEVYPAEQWNLITLNQVLPNHIDLFICDYKNWDAVDQERNKAAEDLRTSNGGSLGIQVVQTIIVTSPSMSFHQRFEQLPGVAKSDTTYILQGGPALSWESSDTNSFALVIIVNSLLEAQSKLNELAIQIQRTDQGLEISDEIFELDILLIEG